MKEQIQALKDISEKLKKFTHERDWEQFHSPKNLAMALSVEAAEVMEIFQWLTQQQSKNLDPEKLERVKQEIGDVLIYLVSLSDALGINPVQAAEKKLEINENKYPADIVRGSAKKYSEYD